MDEPTAAEHLPVGHLEAEAIAVAVGALVTTLVRMWLLRKRSKPSQNATSMRAVR